MKRVVLVLLAGSLALNLYLLFCKPQFGGGGSHGPNLRADSQGKPRIRAIASQRMSAPSTEGSQAEVERRFDWSSVESEDYRAYIANLRSIGCPPETIRDIVSLDLRKAYRGKQWELLRTASSTQYWSSSFTVATSLNGEKLAALRELNEHFNGANRELLGANPEEPLFASSDTPEMQILAKYGDLDWEAVEKLVPIQKQLFADLRRLNVGDPREKEIWRKAEDEMASHLSEQQRIVYELRTSRLARRMRKLDSFASASDFRKAFFSARDVIRSEDDLDSMSDEDLARIIGRR
jgi:hypothetical protein